MNYFLDTEFIEGKQDKTFLGFKYGETKPTIDLISIGIVSEDNREYYAISKDFNLKEAWNREWIRENVLKPVELELFKIHCKANIGHKNIEGKGDYRAFKWMLETYGKTNKQIAKEIEEFTDKVSPLENVQFHGYYSSYDWVAFCWLFNKMIELPKGYNWVCRDLKQEQDRIQANVDVLKENNITYKFNGNLKEHKNYPKKNNEHNALADARWNKELYEFLTNIK